MTSQVNGFSLQTAVTYENIENEHEKQYRKQILNSGEHSDVTFLVGSAEIRMFKAHNCVLMAGSQKFRKILEMHDTNKPIIVPEIEPDVFDQLLNFEIESDVAAVECYKVFQEFDLPSAVKKCAEYLSHKINVENAIALFEVVQNAEHPEILQQCIEIFETKTLDVLKSPAFFRARSSTLETIFSLPQLNIRSELDLVDALNEFAKKNLALPSHNADGNMDRFEELVKPVLAKIRLLTLSSDAIAKSHSVRALLTDEQILCVLVHLNTSNNTLYKIPTGISTCTIKRENSQIINDQKNDCRVVDGIEIDEMERKFKNILNQITTKNLDEILTKLSDIRVESLVELIYTAAIHGPENTSIYVKICKGLSLIKRYDHPKPISFRILLLDKVQFEFEKHKMKNSEQSFKNDEEAIGNAKFIGELYKVDLLVDKIVIDCCSLLLKLETNQSLICLCTLLTLIGNRLECEKRNNLNDFWTHFEKLERLCREESKKAINTRVRLAMYGVMKLRKNKWMSDVILY